MRPVLKWALLATGLVVALPIAALGGAAAYLSTQSGQALLNRQTERIAGETLGTDMSVEIGRQALSLAEFPRLGVDLDNVTVRDKRSGIVLATIAAVDLGLSLDRLLAGDVAVDRLSVETVRVDRRLAMRFRSDSPIAPGNVFTGLDGAFDDLDRIGLKRLSINDVAMRDGPPADRIASLSLVREKPGGYAIRGRAEGVGRVISLAGSAQFDLTTRQLATLNIGTDPIRFSSEMELAKPGQAATRIIVPTRVEFALGPTAQTRPVVRRVSATLYAEPTETSESATSDPGAARVGLSLVEGSSDLILDNGLVEYGGVDARFGGRAALVPDDRGVYSFSLKTSKLSSTISRGAGTPAEAAFELAGRLDGAAGTLSIDKLGLTTGRGAMQATASVDGRTAADRLTLQLKSDDLSTEDVLAFWPFFIAPDAREWALANLEKTGVAKAASFDLALTLGRLGEIVGPDGTPKKDEMHFTLDFEGVGFATVGTLPDIRDVAGHLDYQAGKTAISLTSARFADIPQIAVLPSNVDFEKTDEGVVASLSLNVEGDAAALLALANRDPVDALETINFKADDFGGRAKVGIGAAISLGEGTRKSHLDAWSIVADLAGVDVRKPIEGRRISNVRGSVDLAAGAALGKVTADVDGISATIDFTQPIGTAPVGTASLVATANPSASQLHKAFPGLTGFVDGPVKARLTRGDDGMRVAIGLDAARLTIPAIGWAKGEGVPADLTFDLASREEGVELNRMRLKGDGFAADGSLATDSKGLKSLTLEKASLNRGDDFNTKIERADNGALVVDVGGASLDVRAVLAKLKTGAGAAEQGRSPASSQAIGAKVAVARLTGFSGEVLSDAQIVYSDGGGRSFTLQAAAKTAAGQPIQLAVGTAGDERTMRLATQDAGSLLRFSGLYPRLSGGALRLDLAGPAAVASGPVGGSLSLQHFAIIDEPRLASLVGTDARGGLAGAVGKRFDTSRANFDIASVNLVWDGKTLSASNGILRGPIFGSSFEGALYGSGGTIDVNGAFMPAYRINRLFGAIPLVGGILGNGDEGGLIGITYRLAGAFADPTLTINPISAIAPGIFRRIFEY